MTFQELINAVNASNMEEEAKLETTDIVQWRWFEEEQAEKGEKF